MTAGHPQDHNGPAVEGVNVGGAVRRNESRLRPPTSSDGADYVGRSPKRFSREGGYKKSPGGKTPSRCPGSLLPIPSVLEGVIYLSFGVLSIVSSS